MVLGCFELLLLLGIVAVLLIFLGRYPRFSQAMRRLLRNPRVSGWKLLMAAFFLGFLALVTGEKASKPGHPLSTVMYPLFFSSAFVLFIWAMLRFLGLPIADAPAANRPPVSDKDAQAERPLFRVLGGLIAPFVAWVSRLSDKDLLLGSFLLVAPVMLIAVAVEPPRDEEAYVVVIVFLVWWFVCFAVSALIVWLLRRHTRTACPSVGHLKDLLGERLPAAERARLTAHLELCSNCQHRVEGMSRGHRSWPGMARKLSERPVEPAPALRKVMDKLKEGDVEATSDEPVFAGDLPLDFLSPTDKPGQLGRLERYEVLEEIGRGGMGVVLKAFDPSLHRVVAIKVLAPQLATSGVARKRFMREAKAAAAVTHDHIVTIHAVDEANGLPYLVMQYVAGQSLQDRIDKDGPLELTDILRIGMQTASGLAAAHAHGIVHRDIKPANILLEEGVQRVKITDFGLARAMDDASLTQSGFVAGSPLYMAPEQARGESLDHRADLFSLGSVLYTMCTGRPPFRAANTLAVLRRVSEDRPRPIRETNPEIPEWLADVVAKLMAKEPAERFQSAAEVEEVLGRNLAQLQHASWVPPPRPPAPAGMKSEVADLPTSVTICPSCGASLHVPERMVGSLVHCFECGKPFHVEEGSEVMQVARPACWPVRARRPHFRLRRLFKGCFVIVVGIAGFVLLMALFYSAMRRGRETAYPAMTKQPPQPPPQEPLQQVLTPDYWMATLDGLPPGATLFGTIDPMAKDPWGSFSLDDAWIQSVVRLLVSGEAANQLAPENLGRIQVGRIALGYYEGIKSRDERAIVHLTGMALDGHKRIVEYIDRNAGEKVQVEELNKILGPNGPVCISSPEVPCALKILDDSHAYLAASLNWDAEMSQHRKILNQLPASGIASGYNPPWIRNALASNPHGCGFFIGEIPAAWRKHLTETLKLRACPRTFVCNLTRENGGFACYLTLFVEQSGADQILRDDLNWRPQALNALQARFPQLKGNLLHTSALLGQILSNLHWKADNGSVQTTVRISGRDWKALGETLARVSKSYGRVQP
ncbi:MAG: protein kinase domain-containing protein [Gemmataceae bacterium]